MRIRITLLAFAVALLAGCGSGGGGGGSALDGPGGSAIVPVGAPVFVSVDTDFSSSQIDQARKLLDKFPIKDKLLAKIQAELKRSGVDFNADVKPALGDEVDVAFLDLEHGGKDVVGILKPKDKDKLFAALAKGGGPPPKHAEIGGWTVVADSQALLDRLSAAQSGPKLADDPNFKDATGKLPGAALAKAYVNGAAAQSALGGKLAATKDSLVWASASLASQQDGLALKIVAKGGNAAVPKVFTPRLAGQVPSGAVAFVDFRDLGAAVRALASQPLIQGALGSLQKGLGLKLADIEALLSGEGAIYVGGGGPIPTVALVLEQSDEQQAGATLDGLVAGLVKGRKVSTTSVDGVELKTVAFGGLSVYWGHFDGKIVVTDSSSIVTDLRSTGGKLSDDRTFRDAKAAAGMPDSTSGFVYLNVKDGLPLLEGLGAVAGGAIPRAVVDNLRPIRTLLVYGSVDGDETTLQAFLQVS